MKFPAVRLAPERSAVIAIGHLDGGERGSRRQCPGTRLCREIKRRPKERAIRAVNAEPGPNGEAQGRAHWQSTLRYTALGTAEPRRAIGPIRRVHTWPENWRARVRSPAVRRESVMGRAAGRLKCRCGSFFLRYCPSDSPLERKARNRGRRNLPHCRDEFPGGPRHPAS